MVIQIVLNVSIWSDLRIKLNSEEQKLSPQIQLNRTDKGKNANRNCFYRMEWMKTKLLFCILLKRLLGKYANILNHWTATPVRFGIRFSICKRLFCADHWELYRMYCLSDFTSRELLSWYHEHFKIPWKFNRKALENWKHLYNCACKFKAQIVRQATGNDNVITKKKEKKKESIDDESIDLHEPNNINQLIYTNYDSSLQITD